MVFYKLTNNSFSNLKDKDGSLKAKEIVSSIIRSMKDNEESEDVAVGGFLAIRYLKDEAGLKFEFRANQGMSTLVDYFKSKNENIRRAAVRFAGDLITKCGTSDNCKN